MYLDEIEKYFIKKRKKNLILNPQDWTLVEKWYNVGIPIRIVKQGIDISFEKFFSNQDNSKRTLNTIKYCEPAILDLWKEHKENMVGKVTADAEKFDEKKYVLDKVKDLKNKIEECGNYLKNNKEEQLVELLRNLYKQINALERKIFQNDIDVSLLDDKLYVLQKNLFQKILDLLPSEFLNKIKNETEEKLKNNKNKMSAEAFEKTVYAVIYKKIKEYYNLPEISLY